MVATVLNSGMKLYRLVLDAQLDMLLQQID
jgi:hypothetical protein